MSEANKAVFLSYAREDTDAARRIADALRAFGVEIWFDQNELRGGDAWDQKIRRQIKECTLFVPIVSANTQSRGEGYFRLEWKLAAERTHLMMEGRPFLVPVVVDNTPESAAAVPSEFLRVQWTPLPRGLPSPQFVEHVARLLAQPRTPVAASAAATTVVGAGSNRSMVPRFIGIALAVAVVGVGLFFILRPAVNDTPAPLGQPVVAAKPAARSLPTDKSIAVLPFENLSADKDNNAFFADGVHEDILTNLSLIRELRVVSRTSVGQYRGTKKTMGQIGQELGAGYILEGSVRRSGNTVRVTGQLINARTDEHVWAKSYDRELKDVFAIQTELAKEIAGALRTALSPEEKTLLERRPTENTAAYDLYLKARELHRERSGTFTSEKQATFLQAAVALDPKFTAAWAHLCWAHAVYFLNDGDTTPERKAKAKAAMDAAVRLAPESPEAMRAVADYHYYCLRDFEGAAKQYKRIIELQPNYSEAYQLLGAVRRRQGRWNEMFTAWRKALQLDPGNPSYATSLSYNLEAGRRYAEARVELQRIEDSDRRNRAHWIARMSFRASGSSRQMTDVLAQFSNEEARIPPMIGWRSDWAFHTGNLDEYLVLDQIRPKDLADEAVPGEPVRRAVQRSHKYAIVLSALGRTEAARAWLRGAAAIPEKGPDNAAYFANLSAMQALLGEKEAALRNARRAVALCPESSDTLRGPMFATNLAFVYAWTGDKDRAIAEYARLLRVPYSRLNIHEMKGDPTYHPLRGDPRFETLLNDPKNNAPLF